MLMPMSRALAPVLAPGVTCLHLGSCACGKGGLEMRGVMERQDANLNWGMLTDL